MDNTEPQTGDFLIGVDIGGTFTDCVIIDPDGNVTTAKAPSTPDDFALGMVDALRAGAEALEVSLNNFVKKRACSRMERRVALMQLFNGEAQRLG